jgi:hypothetical protein
LFVCPPPLPVDFFGSLFSFFLSFLSFTIVSYLILNYTQTRDRNSTKWSNGKMKKGCKPFSPQNKLMQDSEGNEENGYPVPDSNKTKINDTREPSDAHKNILKEEIQ